jgi:UDP-N-acetylmuramoylalanine--D-glutamate ligase
MSFLADLNDKEILIFGAGVTGKSTEEFLRKHGCILTIVDEKGIGGAIRNFENLSLSKFYLAIVSPGWRLDHQLIQEARSAGIEMLSEIDLAWRIKCEVNPMQIWYAITGTNGKTTTVQMAEEIFKKGGVSTRACGNVGDTVIEFAGDSSLATLILELSSFQLSWSKEARFEAGAILNIAEDHIDWHGSFQNYLDAKLHLAKMSKRMIVNADDANLGKARESAAASYSYTLQTPRSGEIGLVENLIVDRAFTTGDAEVLFELNDISPAVPHNVANAMAAAGLARIAGISVASIREALQGFRLDNHRLQLILDYQGIKWIDDSKATNPHAAEAALRSQLSSIWIAGGLAKDAQMDQLIQSTASRIKFAILIGTDAGVIASALSKFAPHVGIHLISDKQSSAELMDEVVRIAEIHAVSGDTVLLAPACASMDQFENYADRGNKFADSVRRIINAKP